MKIPFDNFYGEQDGFVEVSDDGLKVFMGGEDNTGEICLEIIPTIDQWGTFYSVKAEGFTVASEAGTRSFLGALIQGLQKLKAQTDMCD